MKKRKNAPGTFVRIPFADGSFGYGRLLQLPYVAFYEFRTFEPCFDLEIIASKPVLFRQAVLTSGLRRWTHLGVVELTGDVAQPVIMFMQDISNFRKCRIFDSAGMSRDATPEECIGVEQAAAWEAHGIEERLLDALLGRPNEEEARSRVRLG